PVRAVPRGSWSRRPTDDARPSRLAHLGPRPHDGRPRLARAGGASPRRRLSRSQAVITDGLTPLTFLLLVGVVLGGAGAGLLGVFALMLRRGDVAKLLAALAFGGVDLYVALLLIAGGTSKDRVLALGQEKHICEVDCHLAYSVVGVETGGTRCTVTVKVRFDETTLSPHLGMAPLTPT